MTERRCLVVVVLALLSSAPALFAQTTAAIEGTVTDSTGGALPGATVEVINANTGISRSLVTDAAGRYRARDLSLGEYRVQASLQGFQTSVRSGIVLTIGREAVVDFELSIGDLRETIEVTGDAPLVNTTSAAVGTLVAREQMADLPLNARDFSQLITLQAGTVQHRGDFSGLDNGSGATGARISISGARPSSNRFVLDGTAIQTAHGQLPSGVGGVSLGLEAVQEFQVLTSSYSAKRGRSVGGTVVAVTRSGTNNLRGSGYWYHRNDGLDSRNFFDRGEKPQFTRNQFGGGLGGPIFRNKTFFFVNHERLHERLPLRLAGLVPTAAARQGVLPDRTVTIDPAVVPYLDLFPLPTPGGRDFGDGTAEYFRQGKRPTDHTYTSVRVDHHFSPNRSMFGRYTRDFSQLTSPVTIELFDNELRSQNQYATLEMSQILSSRLVNQTRLAYTRTLAGANITPVNPPDPSLSNLDGRPFGVYEIAGLSALEGSPSFLGHDIVNAAILGNDLTLDIGRQSIHVGGAFTMFQYNQWSPAREGGLWEWGSMVDFLQNNPATRMRIMGPGADPYRSYRQQTLSLYLQDDVRVSDSLTVNAGVRYDYTTSPTESHGRLSNLRNILDPVATVGEPYYENPGGFFSPRLGLAWDPTGAGNTSIRAGVGLFHEPLQMKDYAVTMRRQAPFWVDLDPENLEGLFPDLDPHFERLAENAPQGTHVFQFDPSNPYSVQMSLGVQQQLSQHLVVELGYTGTRGIHLPGRKDWAVPERTVVDGETFFAPDAQYINPNFTRLHTYDTSSSSWYHGLRAIVTKRYAAGLHFQGAYTWSKALDINSALIAGELGSTTSMDPYDPRRDWGPADFDARQVFTGSISYQLPWGGGLQGLAGVLARGWQVSGIFSAVSGTPFDVASHPRLTHRLLRSGSRPDLAAGGDNNPILGGHEQYFDPMQFTVQRSGFLGNVGRNTLVGPGMAKLDLSVIKSVALGNQRNLQVRLEVFNVLNRVNLRIPSSTLFNSRGARLAAAGRITSTSTTARQMQVAVRFEF